MSYNAGALFEQVADHATAMRLTAFCHAEGIEEAVGVAMIDAEMAVQLLGDEADDLMDPLRRAVERARPLIEGWKTTISVYGGRGGGG